MRRGAPTRARCGAAIRWGERRRTPGRVVRPFCEYDHPLSRLGQDGGHHRPARTRADDDDVARFVETGRELSPDDDRVAGRDFVHLETSSTACSREAAATGRETFG